jgi:hypothetical protein
MNLYRVSLKRQPIQALVDSEGKAHPSAPFAVHYQDPHSGAWYTEDYLAEHMGVPQGEMAKIKKNWRARSKARADGFASKLFHAVVVPAISRADAKETYMIRFGVIDAINSNWEIVEAEEGDEPWSFIDPVERKRAGVR